MAIWEAYCRDGLAVTVKIVARSVHGLEWVCAAEVASTFDDARQIRMARRDVEFELPDLDPRLLGLRCVDDAFLYVGQIDGVGTTKDALAVLARRLAHLDWNNPLATLRGIRDLPNHPVFDCVASIEGKRNYNRYAVENAFGIALARHVGGSFLAREQDGRINATTDLTVRLFVRGSTTVAAFRLGPRPLHRREYKVNTGVGTLHPPVAAALAVLVGPLEDGTALDPFCGDGTVAIETALTFPSTRVLASDIDPVRVANTYANAALAKVNLSVSRADAGTLNQDRDSIDVVLTNPPWNMAVSSQGSLAASLDRFWRQVPTVLRPDGRVCSITDGGLDVPSLLRHRGYEVGLQTQIRLAGRIVHLVLCGAPCGEKPHLASSLSVWRERAICSGVVTEDGF